MTMVERPRQTGSSMFVSFVGACCLLPVFEDFHLYYRENLKASWSLLKMIRRKPRAAVFKWQ